MGCAFPSVFLPRAFSLLTGTAHCTTSLLAGFRSSALRRRVLRAPHSAHFWCLARRGEVFYFLQLLPFLSSMSRPFFPSYISALWSYSIQSALCVAPTTPFPERLQPSPSRHRPHPPLLLLPHPLPPRWLLPHFVAPSANIHKMHSILCVLSFPIFFFFAYSLYR